MPQLGFWLVVAGAAALVIAVFLPRYSTTTFSAIEDNTLIQSGGWEFVAIALIGLFAGYRAYSRIAKGRAAIWGGLIAVGLAIYHGAAKDERRLCSLVDKTACVIASPGVGIYLAGVGGALMAIGGWQLRAHAAPLEQPAAAPASPFVTTPAAPASARHFCTSCGAGIPVDARFCTTCGAGQPEV